MIMCIDQTRHYYMMCSIDYPIYLWIFTSELCRCTNILYFPVNDNDLLLLKVDRTGNEEWSRTWEEDKPSMSAMVRTTDDNYIISGRVAPVSGSSSLECDFYFLKVRPDGTEIWSKRYGTDTRFEIGALLLETTNRDLVGAGGSQDIIIIRINSQGDELWTNTVITYHLEQVLFHLS